MAQDIPPWPGLPWAWQGQAALFRSFGLIASAASASQGGRPNRDDRQPSYKTGGQPSSGGVSPRFIHRVAV